LEPGLLIYAHPKNKPLLGTHCFAVMFVWMSDSDCTCTYHVTPVIPAINYFAFPPDHISLLSQSLLRYGQPADLAVQQFVVILW